MRKVLDGEAVPPLEDPDPMAAEDEFDVASRG